jgi:site-specific DNA recombinase
MIMYIIFKLFYRCLYHTDILHAHMCRQICAHYFGSKIPALLHFTVVTYCRVSTDSDEQATSYEAQVEHYTEYIQKNPDWEFAGIYADDGISGTNTKKREEFNRMIDDCKAGNIDMTITKSINTMDAKGEVLITIMASLAQQESQSLSQNVKLGLQFRYQNGQVQVNHNRFLGYTKDEEGNLVIDPEQAEVVKRIYREYLEGYSMDKIAAGLEADGILTGAGKPRWHTSTINKILRNEKYIGDALLQKTYTTDFLNKTRVKNTGIVPQYYVEGNHKAIIPREIYMRVQEELVRRQVVKTSANGKKRSYSYNHCFSQIIICGDCGEMFRRIHWNNRGCKSIVWRCISKLEPTDLECHDRTINELDLQDIVLTALNELFGDKSKYQKQLQKNIAQVIRSSAVITTDSIDEKLMELQQELVKKANNKEAYDEIADQIFSLREKRQKTSMDTVQRDEQLQRITELQDFIKDQPSDLTVFDEAIVKRWLKQITIWNDHCTVELKSGLKVDVER